MACWDVAGRELLLVSTTHGSDVRGGEDGEVAGRIRLCSVGVDDWLYSCGGRCFPGLM